MISHISSPLYSGRASSVSLNDVIPHRNDKIDSLCFHKRNIRTAQICMAIPYTGIMKFFSFLILNTYLCTAIAAPKRATVDSQDVYHPKMQNKSQFSPEIFPNGVKNDLIQNPWWWCYSTMPRPRNIGSPCLLKSMQCGFIMQRKN